MKQVITRMMLLLGVGTLGLLQVKAQQDQVLPDFTQVRAGETFDIQLFAADRHSLYVESPEQQQVKAEVSNGVLQLNTLKKGPGKLKVKIYFKELKGIQLTGAATVTTEDTLVVPQFAVSTSGASKAKLLLKSDLVKVDASGASSITLAGKTAMADYQLSDAVELKAEDMLAEKVTVQTSGAAHAKLSASELLTANAEGASRVQFSGNPTNKNFSVNGMATIKDKSDGDEFNSQINAKADNDGDTTKVKIGKRKFLIIDDDEKTKKAQSSGKRRMKGVWGGFELGVNGLVTPDMSFNFNNNYKYLNTKVGESWFFSLNLPEIDAHLVRNKLALTTGLGFNWNNIHFDGNSFLTPNSDSLTSTAAGLQLSENKLYTFDLTAPLLLKFAPGTKKKAKSGFHFAAGVIGHYVAKKRVVTETSANGYFQRTELNDDFNINPFRVDATVRVGYGHVKLFANYALTPYFNSSKAPDVRVFAAGLTLIGF